MESFQFWLALFVLLAGYGLLISLVFQGLRAVFRVVRAVVSSEPTQLRTQRESYRKAA